jgi:phosphotransferase system enzyme I (PtsI)
MAMARVCRFRDCSSEAALHRRAPGEPFHPDEELQRFADAVAASAGRVEALREQAIRRIGKAESEIFATQKLIIEDETWRAEVAQRVRRDGYTAEAAVAAVLDAHEARMLEFKDEYLRDRASDIVEIKRRVLAHLAKCVPGFACENEQCRRGRDRIVVTEELTPALALEVESEGVLGFVSARGGVNSHAAILARAMGVPAVSGLEAAHETIRCGDEIAMDGDTGEVFLHPSERTRCRFSADSATHRTFPVSDPVPGLAVLANINTTAELDRVLHARADGIGLYRTEFEFMAAGRPLDEDEQARRYATVVRRMQGLPVTLRLLDGGGDKALPFLETTPEPNPALGWRGARLLLDRTDLLATQARAIARASAEGPVDVLYPMVIDLRQFMRLRDLFEDAVKGLDRGTIRHGVMFEVPAACLQADEFMAAADFASVGTNDLIQHLFAVDRNNPRVAYDYDPDRPVFWSLLGRLAAAARSAGKTLSVCGEAAASPAYLPRLMGLGVDRVSVSPRLIAAVRDRAREVRAKPAIKPVVTPGQ